MAIIRDLHDDTYLAVDNSFKAIRGSVRPPDIGSGGGYYRRSLASGTLATLTNGSMFYAFRNPVAATVIIQNISVGFRAIAGNTTISFIVSLYATRSYTATETAGVATAPTLKGGMMTQTRATQLNSFLRISNTGPISGGTGTNDSQPLASLIFNHPGAISNVGLSSQTFFPQLSGTSTKPGGGLGGIGTHVFPLVLAQNEGFRIYTDTTPNIGTNTVVAYVDVDWCEASSF